MFPYFVWIYIDQFLSLILIHLFCLHLHQFQEFWKLYCPVAVDIHLQIVDDYNYDAMCTVQKNHSSKPELWRNTCKPEWDKMRGQLITQNAVFWRFATKQCRNCFHWWWLMLVESDTREWYQRMTQESGTGEHTEEHSREHSWEHSRGHSWGHSRSREHWQITQRTCWGAPSSLGQARYNLCHL